MMRSGRIREMRDAPHTATSTEVNAAWKLPYAAIEPPLHGAAAPGPPAPPLPAPARPTRADFCRGEKVSFTDRHLQTHVGIITRCNPKTASVVASGDVLERALRRFAPRPRHRLAFDGCQETGLFVQTLLSGAKAIDTIINEPVYDSFACSAVPRASGCSDGNGAAASR